jgi:hypothetical protein
MGARRPSRPSVSWHQRDARLGEARSGNGGRVRGRGRVFRPRPLISSALLPRGGARRSGLRASQSYRQRDVRVDGNRPPARWRGGWSWPGTGDLVIASGPGPARVTAQFSGLEGRGSPDGHSEAGRSRQTPSRRSGSDRRRHGLRQKPGSTGQRREPSRLCRLSDFACAWTWVCTLGNRVFASSWNRVKSERRSLALRLRPWA